MVESVVTKFGAPCGILIRHCCWVLKGQRQAHTVWKCLSMPAASPHFIWQMVCCMLLTVLSMQTLLCTQLWAPVALSGCKSTLGFRVLLINIYSTFTSCISLNILGLSFNA